MTHWKAIEAFCPKCRSATVYMQSDTEDWPQFCCKACDIFFDMTIYEAKTVRTIDES